jgi:uncharacterized protein involved in cysteine biosynthesis
VARRLGFTDGLRAFFQGAGFVIGRPSLWPWAAVPVVIASVLFVGAGALALSAADEVARRIVASHDGSAVALWMLRVVFGIVGLVVAFLVSATLAQPLSGFALDRIARQQEQALAASRLLTRPTRARVRPLAAAIRALGVSLTALAISLPILGVLALVTFLFPPASVVTVPLKLAVTGLAVAYDFLDYPLSLRGAGAGAPLAFVRRHFWATLGFGLAGAFVLLIPGIGLFLLPFGVAGATRLLVQGDVEGVEGD